MALTQLAPPYPIFTDKSGSPLDNGYLYFGTANLNPETNPITVYYDSALTQPAAQPLRTSNGYVMRNGSPAIIYANSQFSVTVRDKKKALVIYSPVGYGITPGTSATSTGQITYNEGSTGAVDRVLTSRLQDYVSVKDFGAVGNGVTDDTVAIQNAINAVSVGSGAVFFPDGTYVHASLINIPAGVRLVGDSRGEKILGGITKGSILKYTGSASGIYINGSMAGIENIALVGTASCTGVGLQLNGDVNAVESWVLKDVSFFGYTAGTALKLVGINTGYVAYGYAESLRFRNCLVGIHIFSTGGGSGFVNTNQFYGGGIAGGSTVNYCIWVQGGNDNRFLGMSVEPSSSTVGHIVVETGWINFDGRIEGGSQPLNIPLVKFSSGTQTSTIAGFGGDGLIIDPTRKNDITINGSKSPKPRYSSSNLFLNATFSGVSASAIPSWTVTGAGVTFTSADSTFLQYCETLTVTVPIGVLATIRQNLDTTIFDGASFSMGVYVKTASTEQISFSMTDGVSTSTGQPYLNDNTLQFMGHRKTAASSPTTLRAQINLNNTAGLSAMVVELTMPMIVVGTDLPYPSSRVLNADYAVMNGLFSTSFGDTTVAISQIVLPRNGNRFVISGGTSITRVNQVATDRFPDGAEITLFADVGANLALADGTYLLLNGAFAAAKQWDNITLIHVGGGIWVEKCRVTH